MNDDLLAFEGWIEVGNYADLPSGRVGLSPGRRYGKRLGRGAILAPLAERALVELELGRRLERSSPGAGSPLPRRGDDDGPAGDRVAPDFGRQLFCP